MRPDETRHIEPDDHEIDLKDEGQVRYWAEKLDATADELNQAVEAVGPNRTAVAIWLGSADAV